MLQHEMIDANDWDIELGSSCRLSGKVVAHWVASAIKTDPMHLLGLRRKKSSLVGFQDRMKSKPLEIITSECARMESLMKLVLGRAEFVA